MSQGRATAEQERIENWLCERVARRLELAPSAIDPERTFDSYGLGSTDAVELSGELEEFLGRELDPTLAYEHPTIRAVARALVEGPELETIASPRHPASREPIAIVGMACRFPGGGETVDEFWRVLAEGRHGARTVPSDRWDADDYLDPDPTAPGKAYTQSGGFVDDIAGFDSELFGLSPAEALRMDPQQRVLLELAWAALEDAGIAAARLRGTRTGVFVGLMESMQYTQLQLEASGSELLNDPFFAMGAAASVAAGRIAYLLDLQGPAISLDTACSSSLVGAHLAVQSLRQGDCDFALVGGASLIAHPQVMVQACKMGMLARDGRVKAFDAEADGFLLGEGSGVVVLERLTDATDNGHPVRALLEGSAINQDGRSNGITAPNRAAQTAVIRAALDDAGVEAHEIDYVETHGSGTRLGDAIEVGALREVFKDRPSALPPVKIGSVKTNIGHLQAAAGIAGLIKTVLMLQHGEVPRTLHLSELNPALKLDGTAISPASAHTPWPPSMRPRRAGVSSFGWSGTNAHAIVQAPPRQPARPEPREPWHVLPLSAASGSALSDVADGVRGCLSSSEAPPLRDVAFTMAAGRAALKTRRALVCRDAADATRQLAEFDPDAARTVTDAPRVAFLFPGSVERGQGSGELLYEHKPVFSRALQRVSEIIAERLGWRTLDLHGAGFEGNGDRASSKVPLLHASRFAVDYAMAELWRHWGVTPCATLGSGVGQYVAACISGVWSIEDAAFLVIEREKLLASRASDPIKRFAELVSSVPRRAPELPFVSSATGTWISGDEATDLSYWTSEMREPSSTANGLDAIATAADVVLEIAPGARATVEREESTGGEKVVTVAAGVDRESLSRGLADLWERGAPIDWDAVFEGRDARRARLPVYPFRHTRYWPDRSLAETGGEHGKRADDRGKRSDLADWCYAPVWRESVERQRRDLPAGPWLVLCDGGAAAEAADVLRNAGRVVTVVSPGEQLEVNPGGDCVVDPQVPGHFLQLLEHLEAADTQPRYVIHAWATGRAPAVPRDATVSDLDAGFASLMFLGQAIARTSPRSEIELLTATTGAMNVLGNEEMAPARAMLASLCQCISAEQPTLCCRYVDLQTDDADRGAAQLLAELRLPTSSEVAAWRGRRRWVRSHDPVRVEPAESPVSRERGVYLITGGLGGLGLALARHLADSVQGRLVLVGRNPLPERDAWEHRLADLDEGDPVAERLRAVLELEDAGAEVLPLAADVSDARALAAAVERAKQRFGAIHGVIHAAGVPGGGLFQRKTRAEADAVLRPKVLGTVNLVEALRDEPLDFIAFYSSAAAVLGGLGESDYAPANAFMDAWAGAADPECSPRVVSIGWGAWTRDSWQQRVLADAPELAERVREYRERLGIADHEGVELLTRILAAPLSTVLVLPQDPETTAAAIAAVATPDVLARAAARRQVFPRPDLRWSYKAPRREIERELARIWSEQLGIDRVGVDDPFFELGGSSLIGLSILARIEAELGTTLPAASLFERPTVGELADLLEGTPADEDDLLTEQSARGERRRELARAARRKHPTA